MTMRPHRNLPRPHVARTRAALIFAAILAGTSPVVAAPEPAAVPGDVTFEAIPVLSSGARISLGWTELLVRIRNGGPRVVRGKANVHSPSGDDALALLASVPFVAAAGAAVDVRVPVRGALYGGLEVSVSADAGQTIWSTRLTTIDSSGVTLLDVSDPPRLRAKLDEAAVFPLSWNPHGYAPPLTVLSPVFDATTGDPILPERAPMYSSIHAVLMGTNHLVRLAGAELEALSGYVLAGGTLALVIARPEDLRSPTLTAFTGGPIVATSISPVTLRSVFVPSLPGTRKVFLAEGGPSGAVAEVLSGYEGGNLNGGPLGAVATYGLGEVHLLAVDPRRAKALSDPWVQVRMVELARRAVDRRTVTAAEPGAAFKDERQPARIRELLDPNEASRWAIGAAAVVLLVYAIVAGFLNFGAATRAGKPLRALLRLPVLAGFAFAIVVGVGAAAKGVTRRARHLTLIEAGAGMPKGAVRRFRGFYGPSAHKVTVRATERSGVLSTLGSTTGSDREDLLVVDRTGLRLVDVAAPPYQLVVVREDGVASMGDGVALAPDGEDHIAVVNRTGHDLRFVLVHEPGGDSYVFDRLADGERVTTARATRVTERPEGGSWDARTRASTRVAELDIHGLNTQLLGTIFGPDAALLGEAWGAFEDATQARVDWFPSGVPTLLAQMDGGEGATQDSGIPIESDRVLVRVLGFGGRP